MAKALDAVATIEAEARAELEALRGRWMTKTEAERGALFAKLAAGRVSRSVKHFMLLAEKERGPLIAELAKVPEVAAFAAEVSAAVRT